METLTDYSFIRRAGDLTDDGVAVFDLETRNFLYYNKRFPEILEVKAKQPGSLTKNILELILAEDLEYLRSRFSELRKKGHINTTEFRLNSTNNEVKHISCDVLMLDNGRTVTAFVKDISQIKKHEDYLIKYTAQKDTLLDMLTHNLNGPLFLSRHIIDSLKKGYNENNREQVDKLISMIQENTDQCIEIVNDFLRQEQNESARTYVRKTRFDIVEKINVTLSKLKEMNQDITFTLSAPTGTHNINSDPVKFFQVIHNILSNAIKFTPSSGKIDIRVRENETNYTVIIQDNGMGIPNRFKSLIFVDRMVGKLGRRGEKSNGLGLLIAKKLVNLMNGQIWFESEEGTGSSFYISLPKE
jgi:two-component system sensor histidine kinase VicK